MQVSKLRTIWVGTVLAGMALSSVCAVISGCKKNNDNSNSASSGSTLQKTQITLDWKPEPEFGGFYAADFDGAFKRHNLDVQIKAGGEGAPTWQLVDTGQSEFATTAADQVLIARARGANVVAVFAVYQTCPQGIMVHRARRFRTIQDAFTHEGTLAVEDNAWVQFLLKKFGTPVVKLITYRGGVANFLAQPDYSQQCFVTSEPIEAQRQGGDPQTFLVADAGYNPYTTVLITKSDLLKQHPEKVKAMVDACREGWRKYLDDSAATNAQLMKLNKDMDAQTFAAAAAAQKPLIETEETKTNGLGAMTLARWQTLAQQLVDLKVIDKAPPAEECFLK
jgi:NitT/TauT family transport system substrate-binding protein